MSADFVAHMEDVLDPVSSTGQALYAEPYDPQRPVVCFDETSTQLLGETRPALPPRPGLPAAAGLRIPAGGVPATCSWPASPWRVGERWRSRSGARCRTSPHQMRWLVDEAYPEIPVVRVVLDNLNTHRMASLYEAFPAAEARRIAQRLGVPLHAQARELVEYGGDRVQRPVPLLPQAAAPRRGCPAAGNPGPGAGTERRPGHHQLAVQHPGRTNQTSSPLPFRFYG